MRPNIVWGKIVFVLGMILCLWFAVWDVLFVIGMITDLVPMYRVGDVIMIVHVAWLVCAIVTGMLIKNPSIQIKKLNFY